MSSKRWIQNCVGKRLLKPWRRGAFLPHWVLTWWGWLYYDRTIIVQQVAFTIDVYNYAHSIDLYARVYNYCSRRTFPQLLNLSLFIAWRLHACQCSLCPFREEVWPSSQDQFAWEEGLLPAAFAELSRTTSYILTVSKSWRVRTKWFHDFVTKWLRWDEIGNSLELVPSLHFGWVGL